MNQPVWITGVGVASPLGNGLSAFGDNLLAGQSGVEEMLENCDPGLRGQLAARISQLVPPNEIDAETYARLNAMEQLTVWCAVEALRDAGWWEGRSSQRIGIALGVGADALRAWELDRLAGGHRVQDPTLDQQTLVGTVQELLEFKGPTITVAAACASGNLALGTAKRWVERGWVDVCLAGATDLVGPVMLAGFGNLRAVSQRVDDPQAASRPFDRDRDGLVAGEGGALFIVENATLARKRRARAYAEVAGFGASSDASHMIIPSEDPTPAALSIKRALSDARINPADIDYYNAHATSTTVGDRAESRALNLALGSATPDVPVSSTKSMTGHLLCAAAAMEAAACLVAIDRQAVPPTINLDNLDPECNLHHVPNVARDQTVEVTASNSFGFGGNNTCLVLRKAA